MPDAGASNVLSGSFVYGATAVAQSSVITATMEYPQGVAQGAHLMITTGKKARKIDGEDVAALVAAFA